MTKFKETKAQTSYMVKQAMMLFKEALEVINFMVVMVTTSSSPMIASLLRQERTWLTAVRVRIRSTMTKRSTSFADARLK